LRITSASVQKSIIPAVVVAAWESFGRAGALPVYLSEPSQILVALWGVAADGELGVALAASLYRVLAGFAIGAAAGVFAGVGAGRAPSVRNFFDPLVAFLFPVPKIAFLPVLLLLFGIGNGSKISVVALSCFFPVFIASRYSVLSINQLLIWSAQNMGAARRTIFLRVVIPAAAPQLFAGVRVGLAHAFVVLFAAELIGSHAGLGNLIAEGEDAGRFDLMLAGILAFGAMGFLGDRILMLIRQRVLKGQIIGSEEQVR